MWTIDRMWLIVLLAACALTGCSTGKLADQSVEIRVRYIGNAGFELTDGRSTILIDFPYESGAFGYMTFEPDEIYERTESLCLFTHAHDDHFDAEELPHIGCVVAGPKAVLEQSRETALIQGASPWQFREASIRCIVSDHGNSDHCSYHLRWHGRSILVAGDVESVLPVLAQLDDLDLLILPYWASSEAPAIHALFPESEILLSHREPTDTDVGCESCRTLGQGETMEL